jgi:hypothetical protein
MVLLVLVLVLVPTPGAVAPAYRPMTNCIAEGEVET